MVDYVEVPDFTTGDTVTADNLDTYLRGNFKSVFDSLVAGHLVRLDATGKHLEDAGISSIVGKRQGGSSTDWNTYGSSNYTPSIAKMQAGSSYMTTSAGLGSINITFPEAFAHKPIIIMGAHTPESGGTLSNVYSPRISNVATTGFTITVRTTATDAMNMSFQWLAIGD